MSDTTNIGCLWRIDMRTKTNRIVMPEECRTMTEEEMEYDGQFAWWPVSAIVSAVGWTCTIVGKATDNQDLQNIGTAVTVIGIASTGIGIATGAAAAVGSAAMTTAQGADFAYSCSIGVGDAILGLSTPYW